jgi:hypothetical protein
MTLMVDIGGAWRIEGQHFYIRAEQVCGAAPFEKFTLSADRFRTALRAFRNEARELEEPPLTATNGDTEAYYRQRAEYVRQARNAWRQANPVQQTGAPMKPGSSAMHFQDWVQLYDVSPNDPRGPVQALGHG